MKRKSGRKNPEFVRMTLAQLVEIRDLLGLTQEEMAGQMETAISTYQDWEHGRSRIPGAAAVCARLLLQKDRNWMAGIPARVAAEMERDPKMAPRSPK
jgi:DNA-binding transcriptional regulator YiaG